MKEKINSSLSFLGKYIKVDLKYFLKGGIWLTIGKLATALAGFLLSIAFANLISKEIFGTYKYVLSIFAILSISTLPGMDTATIQAVARKFTGSFVLGLKKRIKYGFIGSILSICIAIYYYFQNNILFSGIFFMTAFFIPFTESFSIFKAYLYGKQEFKRSSFYTIYIQLIATITIIITLFFTQNIIFILLSYLLSYTFTKLFFLKKVLAKNKQTKQMIDKGMTMYGKKLSFQEIALIFASHLDKILIYHFLGPLEVAVYIFAIIPVNELKSILKSLYLLTLPKFSQKNFTQIKSAIYPKIFYLLLTGVTLVIIYITIAPFFYHTFLSPYVESIRYSQIFAFSIIPALIILIQYSILQSQKMLKEIYMFNVLVGIFEIIALGFGIYYFSITGALVVKIVTPVIKLCVGFYFINNPITKTLSSS